MAVREVKVLTSSDLNPRDFHVDSSGTVSIVGSNRPTSESSGGADIQTYSVNGMIIKKFTLRNVRTSLSDSDGAKSQRYSLTFSNTPSNITVLMQSAVLMPVNDPGRNSLATVIWEDILNNGILRVHVKSSSNLAQFNLEMMVMYYEHS